MKNRSPADVRDFFYFYGMSGKTKRYRLDRTAFQATTLKEADNHYGYWKYKTMAERLDAAFFLIQQSFGTKNNTPLDRTVFSKRKNS